VYYNAGLFKEEGDEIEMPKGEEDFGIFGLFGEEEVLEQQIVNIQPIQEDEEINWMGIFD